MRTIIEIFEGAEDDKKGNAILHKLSVILIIGLLTIICNGNDYAAMVLFVETHLDISKKFLEFKRLNPKMHAEHFLEWIYELKGIINVSIEGKTIGERRSKGKRQNI